VKKSAVGRRLFALTLFGCGAAILFLMLFCPSLLVYHHGANALLFLFALLLAAALDFI
jgi:hypothetical protein